MARSLKAILKDAIRRSGRRQQDIAKALGYNPGNFSSMLGPRRKLDVQVAERIAEEIGLDISTLVRETGDESSPGWRLVPMVRAGTIAGPVASRDDYLEKVRDASEDPIAAMTDDRLAFSLELADPQDPYAAGEVLIITPSFKPDPGEPVAIWHEERERIARYQMAGGTPQLALDGHVLALSDCILIGPVYSATRFTRPRS